MSARTKAGEYVDEPAECDQGDGEVAPFVVAGRLVCPSHVVQAAEESGQVHVAAELAPGWVADPRGPRWVGIR